MSRENLFPTRSDTILAVTVKEDKALLEYLQTPKHGKPIDTCKVITDHK